MAQNPRKSPALAAVARVANLADFPGRLPKPFPFCASVFLGRFFCTTFRGGYAWKPLVFGISRANRRAGTGFGIWADNVPWVEKAMVVSFIHTLRPPFGSAVIFSATDPCLNWHPSMKRRHLPHFCRAVPGGPPPAVGQRSRPVPLRRRRLREPCPAVGGPRRCAPVAPPVRYGRLYGGLDGPGRPPLPPGAVTVSISFSPALCFCTAQFFVPTWDYFSKKVLRLCQNGPFWE